MGNPISYVGRHVSMKTGMRAKGVGELEQRGYGGTRE